MQYDGKALRVMNEVHIERVDFQFISHSKSADKKIGASALDAALAANIVKLRSALVVLFVERKVPKKTKVVAQLLEASVRAGSGQEFLSDGPDHLNGIGANKPDYFKGW